MNDALKKYLQEVKKLLPCSSSEKKRCITELEADVSAFLENDPNATLEELCASFGSPESIAESFMARMDAAQLSHKLSVKRKIAIGVIAIVAILAIVIAFITLSVKDDIQDYHDGYYADTIESLPPDAEPTSSPLNEY